MIERVIERSHEHRRGRLAGGLDELLDDDVVFYSPFVYVHRQMAAALEWMKPAN
jgi:hypothetical protein